MSVLDRSALTESPLADLHAIASELSIDGYRRLRRPELIAAILAKQGGGRRRSRRRRARRRRPRPPGPAAAAHPEDDPETADGRPTRRRHAPTD